MIKDILAALKHGKIVTVSSNKPILEIQPPVQGLNRTGCIWIQETELVKRLDFIPMDKIEATIRSLEDRHGPLTMSTRTKIMGV